MPGRAGPREKRRKLWLTIGELANLLGLSSQKRRACCRLRAWQHTFAGDFPAVFAA